MATIGYVLAEFPVLSETFVGNEMRAMAHHGHIIVPISLQPRHQPADLAAQPEDRDLARLMQLAPALTTWQAVGAVAGLRPPAVQAVAFAHQQTGLPFRSLLGNALKIAAMARRAGCHHLHAHFAGPAAAHAIVAARLLGIGSSFVCHGHDVYQQPTDLTLKLTAADFAIAVCADMTADLQALAPAARVITIPCGIAPDRFTPRGATPGNGRLLFVGRLVEQKGVTDILQALATVAPDHRPGLDIVGDGPLRVELQQQTQQLNLGGIVRFLGSRTNAWIAAEAPHYLGFISAFKPAADGQRDGNPVVIKEAMAMGLPVIATAFMGVKETVTATTGILVEVGDRQALAQAMSRLVQMTDAERRRMGQAACERVQQFTLANQSSALSTCIDAVEDGRDHVPWRRVANATPA